jgi:RNA polymerase sigma factor (sigma-70 family)
MKRIAPTFFTPRLAAGAGSAPGSHTPGAGQNMEFQRQILPHLDGAYNLARYLTRDAVLSDDVVQDAMLRAFRSYGQFRGGSPRAWLFAIVRNCCRTAQTGRAGRIALVVDENSLSEDAAAQVNQRVDTSLNPEEQVIRSSEIDRLRQAIEAMPDPFREIVVLRDLEDLSYAEIAEVTGAPVGTVMSRLSRGRSMLAKELLPPANNELERSRSTK